LALRQVTLINNGSGGTSGTPVSAGNSGGASGNPFDGNAQGTGATFAYDNTRTPDPGLQSFKVQTTSSALAYASYAASMTSPNAGALAQCWFRFYAYFTGNPAAQTTVFAAFKPAGIAASVAVTTGGKVAAYDANGVQQVITTTSIPLNQWLRVEGFVIGDPAAGQLSLTLYSVKDSTIATEGPVTSAATLNTAAAMTGWRFGVGVAAASVGPYWLGNVAISNSGYVGPVGYGFGPVRAANGGCTQHVAVQPAGGANSRMAVCGDVEGFFVSDNQGSTWQTANAGLAQTFWRFTADCQWATNEANTLYGCVGNYGSGGGFLVSQDGGDTWFMRDSGDVQYAGNGSTYPGHPDQSRATGGLIAQTGNAAGLMYTVGYKDGVWRTNAAGGYGASWTSIALGGGTHFGRCICVDPTTASHVLVGMYAEGVYESTNASAGATFTLMSGGPQYPEQFAVPLDAGGGWNGNIYCAAGFGGAGNTVGGNTYPPGGLWQWNATNGWQQLDTTGASLSSSSYWMGCDAYTDAAGLDQVIISCNKAVKSTTGTNYGTNNLMWATVTTTGSVPTGQVFSPVCNYFPNISDATIPPEGRSWWHAGSAEVLGKNGLIQPRATIDKTTIDTSNVTIYCAGSSGFWISTGNTIGASGPVTSTTPHWTLSCDGMPLHIGRQLLGHPSDPLQFGWCTSDWFQFLVTDGVAYNASTTSQGSPPGNAPPAGQNAFEGYAMAWDPLSNTASNPHGTVYVTSGAKYHNDDGQIWAQAGDAGVGNSYQNISAGGPPFSNTTTNPGTSGGQVAYGLTAGRDAANKPYLLAMIQGNAGVGGMWRFAGYTISASGQVNTTGGGWSQVNSTIGTSGGAANIPTGAPTTPLITDPNHAGTHFLFDQASGLWRSTNYGVTWAQIWAVTNSDPKAGLIAINPAVTSGTELWVSTQGSGAANKGLFKIPNANTVAAGSAKPAGTVTVTPGPGTPGGVALAPNGDAYCLVCNVAQGAYLFTQLLASTDGGTTWNNADNGSVAATASKPYNMIYTSNGRLYIANDANIVSYGYPSVPTAAPSAGMTATAAMFAQPQAPGGKHGNATLSASASMTANPPGVDVITFLPVSAQAVMTIGGAAAAFVLQQKPGTALFDYGSASTEITTSAGNTLMVLAGWDLSVTTATGAMPAVYVTDSAQNQWYCVATTTSSVTGSRCTAWICPNAAPVEWVSVSLTTFASSLAYTILELNGQQTLPDGTPAPAGSYMPQYYDLDIYDAAGQASTNTLALMPGATSAAGFAFSVLATANLATGPTTPAGWTPLATVTASPAPTVTGSYTGITGSVGAMIVAPVNPIVLYPSYRIPAAGTNIGTTYTQLATTPMSGITFAVTAAVPAPFQLNPNFPVLKIEAGFGSLPGDPSQAPPAWTDITNRVIAPEGQAFIQAVMGRQYELAAAEAGTLEIWLDNHDGAFTPGNTASPFYPDVVLGTPLRVTAWWNGVWYPVAYGYAERWPQEWPDLPQWGISKAMFTDAISVMAAVTMDSALDSDILLDGPWCLFPLAEQYLSFSNGVNSFGASGVSALGYYHVADAQGLLAQNYSRVNQRNAVYVDGNGAATGGSGPAIASTGQTTNLLGSANTGFGTSAITAAPTGPACGPGVIYTDPAMPDPVTGAGVTVSFWLIVPAQAVSAQVQPTVFTAYGIPSSYSNDPSLTVQVLNFTGNSLLQVTLADGTIVTAPFAGSGNPQTVMLILTSSSLSIYINGSLQATKGLMPSQTTMWQAVSWGCPTYAYGSEGLSAGNFTLFDAALTGCALPAQRAVAQYATGLFGQENVDAVTRLGQILAWAGLGLPRAGRLTFNGATTGILQGPAYNLAGTTTSDAVNQLAVNESGLVAAMPGGAVQFFHRWALFNQSPVAVLGDSPDPTQGQVPYLAGMTWGFDNTYLFNLAQVTQQVGANNLITVTGQDFTSDHEYFPRTALAQTITTMSALDAYSQVQWIMGKYSQPQLRVSTVTVDAASNPAVAFPVILPLQQGQVVTVTRSPVGGATITGNCLTEKIAHAIGPAAWQTAVQASPYIPEGNVLQLDNPGGDTLGGNVLP
jgi:hypothetical protein